MCELVEAHFNEYYLPAKPCPITVFIIMCELVEAHFNEYYFPAKPCPITVFIIPCNLTIANTSIAARPPAANLPSIFSLFFRAAPPDQLLPKNASKRLIRHAKHDCLPKIEEIAQIRQLKQRISGSKLVFRAATVKSCAGYSHSIKNPARQCRIPVFIE